ncbi:hypothetical protein [Aeromicrobium sp.]|uniref:hypothetical protein n=1 Tax=Aeromicrobium sp. TaxID=1871063 RepID=UPI0019A3AE5D|nr:hypothetical protein [Aeromicrobium sp.]MBC7633339.1 hypothetical protein [Aeromicrobium sp.]
MIVAAAVCPHPPMLVPEVAAGAASELDDVRQACDEVVGALVALRPDRIVVLGSGAAGDDRDESAGGGFEAYGVELHAGGEGEGLPLSLTIGAWLLDRAGWEGPRTYSTGVPDIGGSVAVLVMADGSVKRTVAAPGYLDERAEPFDSAIASALGTGDISVLAALDVALGDELGAAGTRPLRTLGELVSAQIRSQTHEGADIRANLRVDVAPLGVGYWVADWQLAPIA